MIYAIVLCVLWVYMHLFFRFRAVGRENIPKTGAAILCANHISNYDPIAVAIPLKRPVHFMAKMELFIHPIVNWGLGQLHAFPVNREKTDMKAIKTGLNKLQEGDLVGIFSQGTRVGDADDTAAKGGVALLAIKSGAPIIPVRVKGRFRLWHRVTVIYGKPITLEAYQGQRLTAEVLGQISAELMEHILALEAET